VENERLHYVLLHEVIERGLENDLTELRKHALLTPGLDTIDCRMQYNRYWQWHQRQQTMRNNANDGISDKRHHLLPVKLLSVKHVESIRHNLHQRNDEKHRGSDTLQALLRSGLQENGHELAKDVDCIIQQRVASQDVNHFRARLLYPSKTQNCGLHLMPLPLHCGDHSQSALNQLGYVQINRDTTSGNPVTHSREPPGQPLPKSLTPLPHRSNPLQKERQT